ncbi:MAG: DUF4265 domain-containing protein [Pseudomonadota bacterium]
MSYFLHKKDVKQTANFKLNIQLPKNAWHGFDCESVWAEVVESGVMCILNSPFFAKGISYKDLVSIKIGPEVMWVDSIIKKSGHSTYRILLDKAISEFEFGSRWVDLAKLGCTYESFIDGSMRMYAVDIPPTVDVSKVYILLKSGERNGVWDFDEGDYFSMP